MGIVSSAKPVLPVRVGFNNAVSIPDGDSFLREVMIKKRISISYTVSIPDGDSFLREVLKIVETWKCTLFQSPMGLVSSAKIFMQNKH